MRRQRARMDVKEAIEKLMQVRGWTKTQAARELSESRREVTKWTSPTNPKPPGPKVARRVLAKVRALLDLANQAATPETSEAPAEPAPAPEAAAAAPAPKAKDNKPKAKIILNDVVPPDLPMQELGGGIRPYVR